MLKLYDINVEGREVVDVGANIGDTAVFFSRVKKASKVIAIEPLPYVFSLAQKNIKANNINNVLLLNASLGSKRGKITIEEPHVKESPGFSVSVLGKGDKRVEQITLTDVLSLLKDPYLLKLDCEGCEYDIILNDYENVRKFEKVIFEYHEGVTGLPYTVLLKKMRDFTCKAGEMEYAPKGIGIFYCEKIR